MHEILTCPPLRLAMTGEQPFDSTQQRGRVFVLYFYPKDNTPGCTQQANDFRDYYAQFKALDVAIFGVSRNSLASHQNFKQKMGYPFELIADTEEIACQAFDVIKMKNSYGKQVRGIERSTFVIDAQGLVIRAWRKVKVAGHVLEVLAFLKDYRREHGIAHEKTP